MTLHGKTVLIPGGAGEVGEGLARAFLNEGARVIVPSRSREKLDALRASLLDPDSLLLKTADVGTANGAARLRDWIGDEVGPLDAVVASLGGWWQGRPLTDVSLDTWHEVLDMGLTTHFTVAKTFLPVLAGQPGASYTFINGGAGLNPIPGAGPLSVSAAGQLMLKDVMAAENDTVRVNTLVLATPVRTRSRPDGEDGLIAADDAGAYAVYLAGDAARDVHGETIVFESAGQIPRMST
jgi:3-oxoacyl-[acyl-carrier protein] reductase